MTHDLLIRSIAHIRTDFPSKFGIPRQAGLAEALEGTVVFEPEFRVDEALRGMPGTTGLRRYARRGWVGTRAWASSRPARPSARTGSVSPV